MLCEQWALLACMLCLVFFGIVDISGVRADGYTDTAKTKWSHLTSSHRRCRSSRVCSMMFSARPLLASSAESWHIHLIPWRRDCRLRLAPLQHIAVQLMLLCRHIVMRGSDLCIVALERWLSGVSECMQSTLSFELLERNKKLSATLTCKFDHSLLQWNRNTWYCIVFGWLCFLSGHIIIICI